MSLGDNDGGGRFSHQCCISAELCRLLRCSFDGTASPPSSSLRFKFSSNSSTTSFSSTEQWSRSFQRRWRSNGEPASQCIQRQTGAHGRCPAAAECSEAPQQQQICQWRRQRWRRRSWRGRHDGSPSSGPLLCSRVSAALGGSRCSTDDLHLGQRFPARHFNERRWLDERRALPSNSRSPSRQSAAEQFLRLLQQWRWRWRSGSGDQPSRHLQRQYQFVVVRWWPTQCPEQ